MKQIRGNWINSLAVAAWILMLPAADAAMQHDHKKDRGASQLPQCQEVGALPTPHCGRVPTPAIDGNGRLWLAFAQNGHVYVVRSDDLGKSFGAPIAVNRIPERIYDDGENRPKIAIGPSGEIYVSWTRKIEGRYAGDVRFSRSLDGGERFDTPLTVNDDRAPISHRFDSMKVDEQGRIFITWIDKRDLAAAKAAGTPYAGAAIYYAVSDDRGASFAFNRKLTDHTCECCRIALDKDTDGKIVVLWRHIYPTNVRDHSITRIDMETAPIQGEPTRATDDGWVVEGCPHHGPDLAVDGERKAHLVWFTQGTKNRGLMYGRFDLASNTLEMQRSIDNRASASRPQVLSLADGQLFAVWKAFNGNETELMVQHSADGGTNWAEPWVVAGTAGGSDYPILIAHEQQPFVSWQTLNEGYYLIPLSAEEQCPLHAQ